MLEPHLREIDLDGVLRWHLFHRLAERFQIGADASSGELIVGGLGCRQVQRGAA